MKQHETTTQVLKWPKSRALTTPNADKAVEQKEFSFTDGKNAPPLAILEDSLAVSHKTKHILTL